MKPQDPPEEGKQTMKNETKKTTKIHTKKADASHFDPGFDVISSVRAWNRTCSKRDAGNVAATLPHVRHAERDVLLAGRSRQIWLGAKESSRISHGEALLTERTQVVQTKTELTVSLAIVV